MPPSRKDRKYPTCDTISRVNKKRSRKVLKPEKRINRTSYLTGTRRGAILKEEAWFRGDRVVKYSLAYINPRICAVDYGRVLGYDNSHDHHHRHFMGTVAAFEFHSYQELVNRFQREVETLWRQEDDQGR